MFGKELLLLFQIFFSFLLYFLWRKKEIQEHLLSCLFQQPDNEGTVPTFKMVPTVLCYLIKQKFFEVEKKRKPDNEFAISLQHLALTTLVSSVLLQYP